MKFRYTFTYSAKRCLVGVSNHQQVVDFVAHFVGLIIVVSIGNNKRYANDKKVGDDFFDYGLHFTLLKSQFSRGF